MSSNSSSSNKMLVNYRLQKWLNTVSFIYILCTANYILLNIHCNIYSNWSWCERVMHFNLVPSKRVTHRSPNHSLPVFKAVYNFYANPDIMQSMCYAIQTLEVMTCVINHSYNDETLSKSFVVTHSHCGAEVWFWFKRLLT